VLVRHGESLWNREDRFTGWTDVGLTELGRRQAASAGRRLRSIPFRKAFSSNLERARESLTLVLEAAGQSRVPVESSAALDERNYGRLQGLVKRETVARFGARQVQKWRRSWAAKPPGGESLKDAAARILPYFRARVLRAVVKGANILLVAHGNTLRVIAMELERLTPKQVEALDFGTGAVLMYEFSLAGDILSRRMLIDGRAAEKRPSTKGERP
jgi:2,3-bisphosphoglycerate-dependent phosphoglycerate mutase